MESCESEILRAFYVKKGKQGCSPFDGVERASIRLYADFADDIYQTEINKLKRYIKALEDSPVRSKTIIRKLRIQTGMEDRGDL